MVVGASFDTSQVFALAARIGFEPDPVILVFVDSDGDPVDISSEDFHLGVKRRSTDEDYLFELEEGDGLEVIGTDSNKLEITPTLAQTLRREETHFGILWSNVSGKAWFSFPFYFHSGVFKGFDNGFEIENGMEITVTVGAGATDTYAVRYMGEYDASSNLFPTTGGSGAGGAIKKGNEFNISVAGTLKDSAEASILVPAGSTIRALVDSPGQTGANWRIYF